MQEKENVSSSRMDSSSTSSKGRQEVSDSSPKDIILSSNTKTTAKQMHESKKQKPTSSSSYTSFPSAAEGSMRHNVSDQSFKRIRVSGNIEEDSSSGNICQSYDAVNPVSRQRSQLSTYGPHLQHLNDDMTSNHEGYSDDYLVSSSRSLDSSHKVEIHPVVESSPRGRDRKMMQQRPKKMDRVDDQQMIDDERLPIITDRRLDRNISLNQSELEGHYNSLPVDDIGNNDDDDDDLEGSASEHIRRTLGQDSFPSDNFDPRPEFTNSYNPQVRDRFRRKLRYFFMNPLDKWRTKGKLPWKLGLQVVKIIVVTLQLLIFGSHMSKYLTHQGNMVVTFRELFMSGWDPVREVMTYPPSAGPYAVYTKDDFYKHVNNAIVVYSGLTTSAIGLFGYAHNVSNENPMSPITLCKNHYTHGLAIPSKFFYNYTNIQSTECLKIDNETMLPGDPVSLVSLSLCL